MFVPFKVKFCYMEDCLYTKKLFVSIQVSTIQIYLKKLLLR